MTTVSLTATLRVRSCLSLPLCAQSRGYQLKSLSWLNIEEKKAELLTWEKVLELCAEKGRVRGVRIEGRKGRTDSFLATGNAWGRTERLSSGSGSVPVRLQVAI